MESYKRLINANIEWSKQMTESDPDFFSRLEHQQSPEYLWIGCSDSRIPPDKITGTEPGMIFVHRNIANLVVNTDINMLSVLQYAVEVLQVKHVIVCGHYGCGGVKAAMGNHYFGGTINHWIKEIKDIYRVHKSEIDGATSEAEKLNKLIEINVQEQVLNLSKTSIIQKAWKDRNLPHLHGWVYGLNNGLIKPVCEIAGGSDIDPIYVYDNL